MKTLCTMRIKVCMRFAAWLWEDPLPGAQTECAGGELAQCGVGCGMAIG